MTEYKLVIVGGGGVGTIAFGSIISAVALPRPFLHHAPSLSFTHMQLLTFLSLFLKLARTLVSVKGL